MTDKFERSVMCVRMINTLKNIGESSLNEKMYVKLSTERDFCFHIDLTYGSIF